MLNKLERDRVQWARNALEKALSLTGTSLHDRVQKQNEIRHALYLLRNLMDGEYSSYHY